ncbi:RidA family protein [Halodesulfovibrio marinisediminis]|uniref:2-iminobutanoate/2-iminopropanoate deaminase n=1 Tax=Halodesulfovibrio marinisediminis DSM 17456 TaxID=1121457 RepID=A0A1N6ED47_9BACT|nr:Rid family detoxifying hydrolase [Halodesulfovibrio marinisediminis]SIN80958.1 2-iminobutanoate/2-iminopropanoate deaminase [Halodesulfovibrio marinisediminis DSM 17456]
MKFYNSNEAGEVVGPYSHCVAAGNTYYISGQVPLHPANGQLVGSTIQEQTVQTLCNLRGVLQAAGLSISNIAKTTVFLTSMDDFDGFNEVYSEFMGTHRPARLCLGAGEIIHGCLLELDAIAYKKGREQE